MNFVCAILTACSLISTPEVWKIKLRLNVPRVYDNTKSLGYRKYQWQVIEGYFVVQHYDDREPDITFCELYNRTHKIDGRNVTYDASISEDCGLGVLWHGIGSNKTCVFNTRSAMLRVIAEPSYTIGPAPTEDNSLIMTLSGRGNSSATYIQGYVAGQLGCGCHEYGHTSPTRIWKTPIVVDTAAVFGTWRAKRVQ